MGQRRAVGLLSLGCVLCVARQACAEAICFVFLVSTCFCVRLERRAGFASYWSMEVQCWVFELLLWGIDGVPSVAGTVNARARDQTRTRERSCARRLAMRGKEEGRDKVYDCFGCGAPKHSHRVLGVWEHIIMGNYNNGLLEPRTGNGNELNLDRQRAGLPFLL